MINSIFSETISVGKSNRDGHDDECRRKREHPSSRSGVPVDGSPTQGRRSSREKLRKM